MTRGEEGRGEGGEGEEVGWRGELGALYRCRRRVSCIVTMFERRVVFRRREQKSARATTKRSPICSEDENLFAVGCGASAAELPSVAIATDRRRRPGSPGEPGRSAYCCSSSAGAAAATAAAPPSACPTPPATSALPPPTLTFRLPRASE